MGRFLTQQKKAQTVWRCFGPNGVKEWCHRHFEPTWNPRRFRNPPLTFPQVTGLVLLVGHIGRSWNRLTLRQRVRTERTPTGGRHNVRTARA